MHDDEAGIAVAGHFDHSFIAKARHVVDDRGSHIDSCADNFGMARIDAHANALVRENAHDIDDAVDLFSDRDLIATRTRGLATHVDYRSAFLDHAVRMRDSGLNRVVLAAIGEGIGRNVEDAHHRGHPLVEFKRGTMPGHRRFS